MDQRQAIAGIRLLRLQVLAHLGPAAAAVTVAAGMVGHAADLSASFVAAVCVAFGAVAALALTGLDGHAPHRRWGAANRVTLLRGGMIALLAGGLALPDPEPGLRWGWCALAAAALLLDGADGWLARRRQVASAYGARFDMELDTLATLVLALLLWRWGQAGPWVVLTGMARPLFVLAGRHVPWLRAPLPPRRRRSLICALSVGLLAAGLAPDTAGPLGGLAAGAALALLLFSFALDTVWLYRHRSPSLADGGRG